MKISATTASTTHLPMRPAGSVKRRAMVLSTAVAPGSMARRQLCSDAASSSALVTGSWQVKCSHT